MGYDANAAEIKAFVARDVDRQSGEMLSVCHIDEKCHAEQRFEPCGCLGQPGPIAGILRAWSEINEDDLGRQKKESRSGRSPAGEHDQGRLE
jgi:hypothetical protein